MLLLLLLSRCRRVEHLRGSRRRKVVTGSGSGGGGGGGGGGVRSSGIERVVLVPACDAAALMSADVAVAGSDGSGVAVGNPHYNRARFEHCRSRRLVALGILLLVLVLVLPLLVLLVLVLVLVRCRRVELHCSS